MLHTSLVPSFGTMLVGEKDEIRALSRQEKQQNLSRFIAFSDPKQTQGVYLSGADIFEFQDLIPEDQINHLKRFAPGTYRFSTRPTLYAELKKEVLSIKA